MTRTNPANLVILLFTTLLAIVSPKIAVLHPEALKDQFKDGRIPHLYANFGFIPYGQSMNGHVYYNSWG